MCFGNGAARAQAKATMDSANMQAASDREIARGNVYSMMTQIAQKNAADRAAELLGATQKAPTVMLAPQADAGTIDPVTGKRKSLRDRFFKTAPSAVSL